MKTQDLFSVNRSSRRINESLKKTFGQKLNLETFDIAQLNDARNKLRTQLSQLRGASGFNENLENDAYHKAQWMLDAINAELAERDQHVIEADAEELDENSHEEDMEKLEESEVQQASTIVTAKTMADRITRWIEDLSGMENDTMLELGDAIRDEIGQSESQQFISSVAPAIEQALETLKSARETVQNAVHTLAGGETAAMLGDEEPDMEEPDMDMEEPDMDMDAEPAEEPAAMDDEEDLDDAFAAADAAAGGAEAAGREQRESIDRSNDLLRALAG